MYYQIPSSPPSHLLQQQEQQSYQNEPLSYRPVVVIASTPQTYAPQQQQTQHQQPQQPQQPQQLQQPQQQSLIVFNGINSPKLFSDPIFYSVFLGCISFISLVLLNFYFFNSYYEIANGLVSSLTLLIGSAVAPLIISRIKQKFSISSGIVILIVSFFFLRNTSRFFFSFGSIICIFAFQLINISIYYLLSLVNFESKYKNLLFGLYYVIQYGLSIILQNMPFAMLETRYVFYPLSVIALIFALLLSKPDNCTTHNNNSIMNIIPNPKVFNNEMSSNNILLIAPVLMFISFFGQFVSISYLACLLTVIPVAILNYKFGKLKVSQFLMAIGIVSAVLYVGYGLATGFSGYGFYSLKTSCSILYSVFSSGTLLIIYSMLDELFPRDKLLSGISTIGAFSSIGVLIGYLFNIGAVIYMIGCFAVPVFAAPSCILFIKFLSNLSQ